MTSSGPYTQSYNFTHMYDMVDLRGSLPRAVPCPGSLWALISERNEFLKFKFLVERAQLIGFFNNAQANYTVFIPTDVALARTVPEAVFVNMDILTARAIVRSSTLFERLSSEVLQHDPVYTLITADTNNRLRVSNGPFGTVLNESLRVIQFDILCTNGIAHVIDGLMRPIVL